MKIDVTHVLCSYDGEPLIRGDGPLTLRQVCCEALASDLPMPGKQPSGEDKVKRFNLAVKIYNNDTVDLPADAVAMIKALIGTGFAVPVVGPAFLALEGGAHVSGDRTMLSE